MEISETGLTSTFAFSSKIELRQVANRDGQKKLNLSFYDNLNS